MRLLSSVSIHMTLSVLYLTESNKILSLYLLYLFQCFTSNWTLYLCVKVILRGLSYVNRRCHVCNISSFPISRVYHDVNSYCPGNFQLTLIKQRVFLPSSHWLPRFVMFFFNHWWLLKQDWRKENILICLFGASQNVILEIKDKYYSSLHEIFKM